MDEFESGRFPTVTDEELLAFRDGRLSNSLMKTVAYSVNVLNEYALAKGTNLAAIEQLQPADLDKYLGRFYAELRKADGSQYARTSLVTLRYGLQHHFIKVLGTSIVSNSIFDSSNHIFKGILVKAGKSDSKLHNQPLSSKDFNKLYMSEILNTSTPTGLQNKVFVDLMVHLCRGRKNLRNFIQRDFRINTDSRGRRYVSMIDQPSNNDRGDGSNETSQQSRMYETPKSEKCPVLSFEKYVSKLNADISDFWQVPVKHKFSESSIWYMKGALGKNALYDKMKTLSSEAGLSVVYTNNCLRATRVTALDRSCLHTMNVGAHSNLYEREACLSPSLDMSVNCEDDDDDDDDDYGDFPAEVSGTL